MVTGGILFFGTNALAEESEALKIFNETVVAAPQDTRPFNQSILLFGTNFRVDIRARGLLRDNLKMSGDMTCEYINPETNRATANEMPFYVEQSGANTIMYVQRGNKWQKFALPNLDINELQKNITAAEIVSETNTQKIFKITLSGAKMAENLREYDDEQDTTALSMEEVLSQKKFLHNLAAAFDKTNLTCTWTIARQTNETVSIALDLTPLVKAYAKNILDETAAGIADATNEDKLLMESISRYSEFHFLLNYIDTKKILTPPAAARKAEVNYDIFEDFFKTMTVTN